MVLWLYLANTFGSIPCKLVEEALNCIISHEHAGDVSSRSVQRAPHQVCGSREPGQDGRKRWSAKSDGPRTI